MPPITTGITLVLTFYSFRTSQTDLDIFQLSHLPFLFPVHPLELPLPYFDSSCLSCKWSPNLVSWPQFHGLVGYWSPTNVCKRHFHWAQFPGHGHNTFHFSQPTLSCQIPMDGYSHIVKSPQDCILFVPVSHMNLQYGWWWWFTIAINRSNQASEIFLEEHYFKFKQRFGDNI